MSKGVNVQVIQYVAIAGSLFFIASVLFLISRRKLREEFSLLWLFFGLIFLGLSLWRQSLNIIAELLGIAYPPAAIFLILIIGIISILIHFSIAISGLTERVKILVQEVGMLKMEANRKNQTGSLDSKL